jgi:hypothetical protein
VKRELDEEPAMRVTRAKVGWLRLATLGTGTALFLNGCDPSVKETIEDGVITLANSFLTALLQAIVQLGAEATESTV